MLIGLSGVLPNLLLLWGLTTAGLHYLPAAALATQVAIVWNFIGAELWVWRDHRAGDWEKRFAKFVLVGETDLVRLPFVYVLVTKIGVNSLGATALTLLGAFACRFTLADKVVYRRAKVSVAVRLPLPGSAKDRAARAARPPVPAVPVAPTSVP